MRMRCNSAEIGQTDSWLPQATFAVPIETFLCGNLVYDEGIDRQDFYRGVFGWVDGLPVALKAHAGAPLIGAGPDRQVTLYLSDRIPDIETAASCVDLVVRAFRVGEADVTRLCGPVPVTPMRRPHTRRAPARGNPGEPVH